MSKHNIENRNIEIRSFDISNDPSSRQVSGYAVVFNSVSQVLYDKKRNLFFREIISPEAITQDLLESSDIVMNYGHNDDLILARSKNGTGTLSVSLDEKGLYFSFDMPDTALGNQIRESIQRGDITSCSFAFRSNDNDDIWDNDGDIPTRTICSIIGLYDCAIVVHPAYEETEVSARSLEKIQELQYMKKEDIELREKDEDVKDPEAEEKKEETQEEDPKEAPKDEEKSEDEEAPKEEDPKEEEEDREEEDEDPEDEDPKEKEDEKDPEEERQNKSRFNTMEKRFSLLTAIREVANNQKLDAASQAVVNAGAEAMRNAGQPFNGQIQIPVAMEMRNDPVHYTVEADGSHVVVTDYLNILEPLKAKNVLVAAGANYLTGLRGNIQIPSMTAENVYWEGEITDADNGAGSFDHINMAPRRLSAYIDISKQFLVQDTLGAENLIRKLLVEAINDKLEATILSDDAASGNVPAGIFNGVTPTDITDFASVCDFEAELDENNFIGDFKYVISPKAKSYLRASIKGTNATGMIMENDSIDGTACETTTHMAQDTLAYGDWSQLYIGQWGAIDLTVDPYTKAASGQVRLVINAFFDYKVVRDGAIVLGQIDRS